MSDIIGKDEALQKVVCNNCKHYHRNNLKSFSCDAFKTIPDEILMGDNKHTKPLPTQRNNIVFEATEK